MDFRGDNFRTVTRPCLICQFCSKNRLQLDFYAVLQDCMSCLPIHLRASTIVLGRSLLAPLISPSLQSPTWTPLGLQPPLTADGSCLS